MSISDKQRLLVDFIDSNYDNDSKIIEVGVGEFTDVFLLLKTETDLEIHSTDIVEGNENYVDDITKPDLGFYEGSDLIYSIRPPIELQKHIAKVCREVDADMMIVPFDDEILDLGDFFREFSLVNLEGLSVYRGVI